VGLEYFVDVRAGGVASRWRPWYRVQAWIFWSEPDGRTVSLSTRRPVSESEFLTLLGLLLSASGLTAYF